MSKLSFFTTLGLIHNLIFSERNKAVIISGKGIILANGCSTSEAGLLIERAQQSNLEEENDSNYLPFS